MCSLFCLASIYIIFGASCKHHYGFISKCTVKIEEALQNKEISTNYSLNQEMNLEEREIQIGILSHYGALGSISHIFCFVINVIKTIVKMLILQSI